MLWNDFLKKAADAQGLFDEDERQAFFSKFADRNPPRSDAEVATDLNTSEVTLQRRLGRVYAIFASSCPSLNTDKRGKGKKLRDWLKAAYVHYEETENLPGLPTTSDFGAGYTASVGTIQKRGISEDFYVEPPIINSCYNEILKSGCLLRIKASWRMGKTELMSRVLNYAINQGYRTAVLNLRDATTTDFSDLNQFLKWFCTSVTISIIQEHLLTNPVDEHWDNSIGNSKNKCKTYFEKYLLPGERPLALALDEVDRVFHYQEIAREFLGMLRTRHEDAKTRPIWGKLRQVLVYTEDYREIDINQSPFNAGIARELPELSHEQVQNLVRQYGLDWDSNQVNQLIDMVGGHPYLVKEAIKNVMQEIMTLNELLEKAPSKAGIYSEYLQRYWRRLQQSQDLATAFHQIVMADVPVELNSEWADKLYDLGLVKFENSGVIPRYELYRQYFRSR